MLLKIVAAGTLMTTLSLLVPPAAIAGKRLPS